MMDLSKKYFGQWFICDTHDECYECAGTLFFNAKGELTLEVHHDTRTAEKIYYIDTYDTIIGKDDHGVSISLFHAVRTQIKDRVETTFRIQYALIGKALESLYDKAFNSVFVNYPNLRNWAFHRLMVLDHSEHLVTKCRLDFTKDNREFMKVEVGGYSLMLRASICDNVTIYDLGVKQDTYLTLKSQQKSSIDDFLNAITPFSQFLSIALFHRQFPNSISLMVDGDDYEYDLLFTARPSDSVQYSSVINYKKMSERVPALITKWYEGFDLVSPVSTHLLKTLSSSQPFDDSDFLIIAQAVEGYFKRFINGTEKTQWKRHTKNEVCFKGLVEHFGSVEAIKECNFDPEVWVQTRDKYTHMLKDEDKPLAITDYKELIWLTEKGKILLTCCLLDFMGMTIEEINTCFKESPIDSILHFIKEHEKNKTEIQ